MMAATETTGRPKVSRQMLVHCIFGRHFGGNQERLDSILLQFLGRTPAHAVAKHRLAILEGLDNSPMAMMVIVLSTFLTLTLAPGMGREGVVPHRMTEDCLVLNLENREAPAAAEVVGNGNAVLGSYCDLHLLVSLFLA
jgi:hypothetical protein